MFHDRSLFDVYCYEQCFVCCISYDVYFNNKIGCVVYSTIYGSVTKLGMLCILWYT